MRYSRQLSAVNATNSYTGQDTIVVGLLVLVRLMNTLYCYYFIYLYIREKKRVGRKHGN
jgi:hypothetical protein